MNCCPLCSKTLEQNWIGSRLQLGDGEQITLNMSRLGWWRGMYAKAQGIMKVLRGSVLLTLCVFLNSLSCQKQINSIRYSRDCSVHEIVHFVKINWKVDLCQLIKGKHKKVTENWHSLLNHTVGRTQAEIGPCWGW